MYCIDELVSMVIRSVERNGWVSVGSGKDGPYAG